MQKHAKCFFIVSSLWFCLAFAADDVATWQKCTDKEQSTPAARQAQTDGGTSGLEEFLIDRCGYRPTVKKHNAKKRLLKKDCTALYDIAQEVRCDSMAAFEEALIKQLDPQVFDESRFNQACFAMKKPRPLSRSEFGVQVCGE